MIPPPPSRAAAPGREAGAGPASMPQPPALGGAAMGKRTRASAQGRHTDHAQRQQANVNRSGMGATRSMARATPRTPALFPARERQRDGLREGDPRPTGPPGRTVVENSAQAAPPPPPPGAGMPQTRRPTPQGAHSSKPGRGETGPGRPPPPPSKPNGARTSWNGPTSAQHRDRATCARHTNRGGGGADAAGARAHTHTKSTRGLPEGQPDRARGTHRPHGMAYQGARTRDTRTRRPATHSARNAGSDRGLRGRHNTRHHPKPPEPAASTADTQPGHCTSQGSSGAPRHAPAPGLGSLRASPEGSHWRQASSTGPAVPAPQATTHQGGDAVGKRLQLWLLSNALTGEWRNEEAGEGRGPEPCEPGGLRQQAAGAS